jgi:hypothetical protein
MQIEQIFGRSDHPLEIGFFPCFYDTFEQAVRGERGMNKGDGFCFPTCGDADGPKIAYHVGNKY